VGHDDDPSNNVGIIETVDFDGKNVNFFAPIFNTSKHPDAIKSVKNRLWQHVSIEAVVPELVKKDEKFIARGINFTGLAFVKTPGIENASAELAGEGFGQAIAEAYSLKEEDNMTKEEEKKEEEVEEQPEDEAKEPEVAEEKVDTSKIVSEVLEALEKKEKSKEDAKEKVKLQEKVKELEKKLEEKAKSEAVVAEATTKEDREVIHNPTTIELAQAKPGTFVVEGLGTGNMSFWQIPKKEAR